MNPNPFDNPEDTMPTRLDLTIADPQHERMQFIAAITSGMHGMVAYCTGRAVDALIDLCSDINIEERVRIRTTGALFVRWIADHRELWTQEQDADRYADRLTVLASMLGDVMMTPAQIRDELGRLAQWSVTKE